MHRNTGMITNLLHNQIAHNAQIFQFFAMKISKINLTPKIPELRNIRRYNSKLINSQCGVTFTIGSNTNAANE